MGERFVIVLGALDTKAAELAFLEGELHACGWATRVVDLELRSSPLAKVEAMTAAADATTKLVAEWVANGAAAIVALGGGVGTWIAMRVMSALPFGLPKMMISTLPFDVRPHLGAKDIVVVPTVVDLLGLNAPLRTVLRNAAVALAAMAGTPPVATNALPAIGATGLGVTTPAMLALRRAIEAAGFELVSFHAAGYGGAAYEAWVERGSFAGVIDLTTGELTSELFGGLAAAHGERLTAASRTGVPQVVVPGALDFVTRGPIETLSAEDRSRAHVRHSPTFTHVRIDAAGMRSVAREVARRLDRGRGPTIVAVPLRGFSAEGRRGGALDDVGADGAFIAELHACAPSHVRVVEIDAHINDEAFAARAWQLLRELMA